MDQSFVGAINSIVSNLEVATSQNATNQQRIQATHFLESIKQQSADQILQIASQIVGVQLAGFVRHFGFQLLEHLIKSQWEKFTPEQKQGITNVVFNVIKSGLKDLFTEEVFIKHKVASLLVEIAKREFPQHWPNFFETILPYTAIGVTLL
jgi:exportin-5